MCPLSWLGVVRLSPPLKTWEVEGSCDLNSLIYWESKKILHGKYLCYAGMSGGFGVAMPGQAKGAPSQVALIAKAWWQLPGEGAKRDKSYTGVPPKPRQRAAIDPAMLSTSSLTQLSGFCFALGVKLLGWQGTSLPAPWLRFPVWAERLLRVCSHSGVWWRQVHSGTLKSSDEKRWRKDRGLLIVVENICQSHVRSCWLNFCCLLCLGEGSDSTETMRVGLSFSWKSVLQAENLQVYSSSISRL